MGHKLKEMEDKNNTERINGTENSYIHIVVGLTTSSKMKWERTKT